MTTATLPRSIYIEPTSRCNELCQQCPRTLLSREDDRDLSFDDFRSIVDQFPELERVVLHGLGEPLLNKALPQMIRYLKARGTYVLFNSNGILLNAKWGQELIDAGLDEYVSRSMARRARRMPGCAVWMPSIKSGAIFAPSLPDSKNRTPANQPSPCGSPL